MSDNDTQKQISDAVSLLTSLGWREYRDTFRDYARMFQKRYETPTRCCLNNEKSGVSVCLSLSDALGHVNIEMEVVAGLPDETWINIHHYSLPKDVNAVLAKIPVLLAAWEAAASCNPQP